MRHILFFALKDDILPVLESVESKGALQYARIGNYRQDEISGGASIVDRGADIPNLGHATADSTASCESFLVSVQGTPIELRAVQGAGVGGRVCIDQLANADSVTFTPGGILNNEIVLHGRIATASDSNVSHILMKQFNAAIKTAFTKVKAFYVGPKALELLQRGTRLTISAQSPREFDLTPAATE